MSESTLAGAPTTPFTMVGAPDAAACEGDACVIPDTTPPLDATAPLDAVKTAAASVRAVTAALDEGASL